MGPQSLGTGQVVVMVTVIPAEPRVLVVMAMAVLRRGGAVVCCTCCRSAPAATASLY